MIAHPAVAIDDENGRPSDAALFFRVVNVPLLHDAPLRITQDRKWQVQLLAHRFGFPGRVNRDCRDVRTCRANFAVVLTVIRQLAETEGSPVTAKENKDDGTLRSQIRQPPQRADGVRQLEVGRDFSGVGQFGAQHGDTL